MKDETLERPWTEVKANLLALSGHGFEYLQTDDDGLTWTGSDDESGVPIGTLLQLGTFRGNVTARDSSSSS